VKVARLFERLTALGWTRARVRGSHHVFKHRKGRRSIPVPVHGKDISDVIAKAILKQAEQATRED
jgi:predicted RNA binding protein YcfA (HicA-like mRNA interferase family)